VLNYKGPQHGNVWGSGGIAPLLTSVLDGKGPPGKEPPVPIGTGDGWAPEQAPTLCRGEKVFPLAGIEPRVIGSPSSSIIAIPTDNLIVQAHAWMDWGKLRKTWVRIAGLRASVWTRTSATQCTVTFQLTPYSSGFLLWPTVPQLSRNSQNFMGPEDSLPSSQWRHCLLS
jgi:hypothetical protein